VEARFSTPYGLWGPHSLLYVGYWVSFSGVKKPGHGANHPLPSISEVKEGGELYLYSTPSLLWKIGVSESFLCLSLGYVVVNLLAPDLFF